MVESGGQTALAGLWITSITGIVSNTRTFHISSSLLSLSSIILTFGCRDVTGRD